jgi:hypothetical protein
MLYLILKVEYIAEHIVDSHYDVRPAFPRGKPSVLIGQPYEIHSNRFKAAMMAKAYNIQEVRAFNYKELPRGIIDLISLQNLNRICSDVSKINFDNYYSINQVKEFSEEQKYKIALESNMDFFRLIKVRSVDYFTDKNELDPDKYSRFRNLKI